MLRTNILKLVASSRNDLSGVFCRSMNASRSVHHETFFGEKKKVNQSVVEDIKNADSKKVKLYPGYQTSTEEIIFKAGHLNDDNSDSKNISGFFFCYLILSAF